MYKVSVVTPFHNVDMAVFQKAADSMKQQTIGFENIEWVIVVHNSESHYLLVANAFQQMIEQNTDPKSVKTLTLVRNKILSSVQNETQQVLTEKEGLSFLRVIRCVQNLHIPLNMS